MADSDDTLENPVINLDNIDVGLQAVLAKCDLETRENIVAELEREYEKRDLIVEREKLFDCAKSKFEHELLVNGLVDKEETTNLVLSKRTGTSSGSNIAREVNDLYLYVVNRTKTFPRGVLCKTCKYIEVVPKDNEKNKISNPVLDKMKISELANTVRDMMNQMDIYKKEKNEDKVTIKYLEQEVVQLQGQVKILQPKQSHVITNVNPGTNMNGHQDLGARQGDNPMLPGAISNNEESIGPWPPLGMARGPVHIQPPDRQHHRDSQVDNNNNNPKTTTRTGVTHIMDSSGGHTTLLHKNKPLSAEATAQALQGKQPALTYQTDNSRQSKMGSKSLKLRGVKQERGSPIYIQQIRVDNESDDEIGDMIKEHCNTQEIRVMKYRIFRYKACYDTVGCRIIVPESQEHLVLDPQMWPDGIVCRRWKPAGSWIRERDAQREEKRRREEGFYGGLYRDDGESDRRNWSW